MTFIFIFTKPRAFRLRHRKTYAYATQQVRENQKVYKFF